MNKHCFLNMLVIFVIASIMGIIFMGCGGGEEVSPPPVENVNLIALHNSESPSYDKDCIKCHGKKTSDTTLNPDIPAIHPFMMPFTPGYTGKITNELCATCHTSVDYVEGSAGNLRRNVAVGWCVLCHIPGGTGKELYIGSK